MPLDFSRVKSLQEWLLLRPWLDKLLLKFRSCNLQINMLTHSHNLRCMLLKLKLQLKESFQEATKLILDKSSIQLEPQQVPGLIRTLSQLPQEAQ